jgi:thiaminase/transcriptional activator TenA
VSSFSDRLRAAGDDVWARQHAHPFVTGIADGTLPEAAFRYYVRQDYLFLIDYGRLLALGAVRAPRLEWMRRFATLSQAILESEMDLHRAYAASWGIDSAELEAERPAPATSGYTDFLLRTAALGDFAELAAALLPCMWGYAEIGERLGRRPRPDHARYAEWIDMYAGDDFQVLGDWSRELVDAAAVEVGGPGHDRMLRAFLASSEHELAFWESAWQQRRASAQTISASQPV